MSKTDLQLKQDVQDEIDWDPKVNAAQIGVTVDKGAVSLLGEVDTYAEKWAAEDAVKRVSGVRTVAQDLTVKLQGFHKHSDSEIAAAALSVLTWDVRIPKTITANVHEGRVTLEGQADWHHQREAAERAVRFLTGVISVQNSITINSAAGAAEVKEKVQAALQRQAIADSNSIHVVSSGGTVTLSGNAASWRAIEDATAAAWSAPGVTKVIDNLAMVGF